MGCSGGENTETLGRASAPVVYGTDDRQELFQTTSDEVRRAGESSLVALVEDAALSGAAAGDPRALFATQSWAERRDLCDTVRFGEQPAAASCSGVLAGDDLVLTAGHCARNLDCSRLHVVFGYSYGVRGEAPVLDATDVYRCSEVLAFEIPSVQDQNRLRLESDWIAQSPLISGWRRSSALPSP